MPTSLDISRGISLYLPNYYVYDAISYFIHFKHYIFLLFKKRQLFGASIYPSLYPSS